MCIIKGLFTRVISCAFSCAISMQIAGRCDFVCDFVSDKNRILYFYHQIADARLCVILCPLWIPQRGREIGHEMASAIWLKILHQIAGYL
jgi:hypothetical protein